MDGVAAVAAVDADDVVVAAIAATVAIYIATFKNYWLYDYCCR